MTKAEISNYRKLANKHNDGKHRSAAIILELCDEIEKLQRDYGTALDAAFAPYPMKGRALAALKRKAGIE
jgi:hypothetical protein